MRMFCRKRWRKGRDECKKIAWEIQEKEVDEVKKREKELGFKVLFRIKVEAQSNLILVRFQ